MLRAAQLLIGIVVLSLFVGEASASTYVVYLPLDSPVYEELETLNGFGLLKTYLGEIKPISRVEAARLTLEAEHELIDSERDSPLARSLIHSLRLQLREEVGWLLSNHEDGRPATLHPIERVEGEYIFSRGPTRFWNTGGTGGLHAAEGTPLLPNNDGIPTGAGSNEVLRWSGWGGVGGFLTGYGEVAAAGPITHELADTARVRPLGAEAVVSLGNFAASFGQEEMWWGTGHFAGLSQGDNAAPFPGLHLQNIHPILLPWIFRYLGQFRYQIFFGQLDGERYFAHPWIDGQVFSFRPLPHFEFGLTHTIAFGGRFNNNYGLAGFIGRATGFATGSPVGANTNSRGGVYLKFYFPEFRDLQVYQELVGEDNLTTEARPVGRFLPFLAVSYQGGIYLPRLTSDGLTDLRIEYALLEPGYSIHDDSLYWTYNGALMGDPLGPNATEAHLQVGRWFPGLTKGSIEVFYTERAPTFGTDSPYPARFYGPLTKEHSGGVAFDLFRIPQRTGVTARALLGGHARMAVEYVDHMNYGGPGSLRAMVMFGLGAVPTSPSMEWR